MLRLICYVVAATALTLAGCAGPQSAYEPPIVDQTGVDPATFQRDQSECIARVSAVFNAGAPGTACMREKGYRILVPKG